MEQKRINYVVAFYAGPRRHYGSGSPCLEFAKAHVEWLKTNPKGIDRATFIFNHHPGEEEIQASDYLNEQISNLSMDVVIGVRDNVGMSYGIWGQTIADTKDQFQYTFTIEDDYYPVGEDAMDYFISKVKDDTIFVASLYKENYGGHAAISNGLIVNKHINQQQPFTIVADNSYSGGGLFNQTQYLRQYQDRGFKIEDITDVGYTEFSDSQRGINLYGDQDKPLLIKANMV